jgi:phosphohistidine phosphatase SixA
VTVFLVRHALAGNRDEWEARDEVRPLSTKGWKQAKRLADLLVDRDVTRIVSSPYLRCFQTVEPLAERLGVEVEHSDALAEGVTADEVVDLVRSLAGANAVLSTHGDVVPTLLDTLVRRDGLALPEDYPCEKGATWALDQDDSGQVLRARYLPPP